MQQKAAVVQLDDYLDRYRLVPETRTRPHTQRNWIAVPLKSQRVGVPSASSSSSSTIGPDFDGENDAQDSSEKASMNRKRKLESTSAPEAKRAKTKSKKKSAYDLICWESVTRVGTAVVDAHARKRLNSSAQFSINTALIDFVKQSKRSLRRRCAAVDLLQSSIGEGAW